MQGYPLRTFSILIPYIVSGWIGESSVLAQTKDIDGYRLTGDRLIIDQAVHWQSWTHPKHAVEIDGQNHTVRPRFIRKEINAIADMDHFQIKIGDQGEYDKLLRTLQRDDQLTPLNIRTGPATVAGFPLIYQKDNASKGVKEGDPVPWYFYHGGIRQASNNSDATFNILDGDPATYWEPTTEVSAAEYGRLPDAEKGPFYYLVTDEQGRERRVDRSTYQQTALALRRIVYHRHALDNWYVEVDLGRVVPVSRIVLRFVEEGVGEPFRRFRLLGTSSHSRQASLSLLARTDAPNEELRLIEFDLDPEDEGQYEQLQRLRIVVTDSKFDKFKAISQSEYDALPESEQGGIDYYVLTAGGSEVKRDRALYEQVEAERRGRQVFYRRERPRLADVEVWAQGDNVSLGMIDGGGSVSIVSRAVQPVERGFDGRTDTRFNHSHTRLDLPEVADDRGLLTLDLGAVFPIDHLRMLGCCSGAGLVIKVSDGKRQPNGKLEWVQLLGTKDPIPSSLEGLNLSFASPLRLRFFESQLRLEKFKGTFIRSEILEFQLFGQGYVPEVAFTSPLIDLPESVVLGSIAWAAAVPDLQTTDLEIRTRSGDQLIEETVYYTSGGRQVTEKEYDFFPSNQKGPRITQRIPGAGWSPWSQKYFTSGERITSPTRKFLQIQTVLHSSPQQAPTLRSIQVHFLPPVAHQTQAELWPEEVSIGVPQTFDFYLNSTFVERRPQGTPSTRFDELFIDADPMTSVELVEVGLGSENDLRQGTAQRFHQVGWHTDPVAGKQTPWFTDADGNRFQVLIDPVSGDSLQLFQGHLAGRGQGPSEPVLHLRLPVKVAALPSVESGRVYNRVILSERDEVPVDEDGRLLNELVYLALPEAERGRILYFARSDGKVEGSVVLDSVDRFTYLNLPDSLRGEIRYFRTRIGGEFPFDREGKSLAAAAYNALPQEEQGSILAAGQLVHLRFQGTAVLHGTTVDVSIRDSAAPAGWQQVDPGDATELTPATSLSLSVPFNRRIVHNLRIAPNPFTPNGDGINDQAFIDFDLAKLNVDRAIQVQIYDLSGRRVWEETRQSFNQQSVRWDGRDTSGEQVPPGLYLCKVSVSVDEIEAAHTTASRLIAVAY